MKNTQRNSTIVKTSILGILTNLALVGFKATVGLIVGSIAIVLDAVNNFTDALSSIITIIGAKLSAKAPDQNHPYGHGRIEYFTTLIIAAIVFSVGLVAAKESVEKILSPTEPDYSTVSLLIIFVAILTKVFIGHYTRKVGTKINSGSLVASGQDALMDAVLSTTTLVSGILNLTVGLNIEGYLGAIISVVIIKSSIEMMSEAIQPILGARADEGLAQQLKDIIEKHPDVQGVYDINLHNYGPEMTIASAHIQVESNMPAKKIHIMTREIEYEVYQKTKIALTIGIYAANDEGEFREMKQTLTKIIQNSPGVLQLHGFYVDQNKKDVYFDLVLDFDSDTEKIKNKIISKMQKQYPDYSYNIIIDANTTIL